MKSRSISRASAEKHLRYKEQIKRLVAKAVKAGMSEEQIQTHVDAGIAKGEAEIERRRELERQRQSVQIVRRVRRSTT